MSTTTSKGYKCEVKTRIITAYGLKDKVFGKECTADSLTCDTGNSRIIWNSDIVHSCPLNYISSINGLSNDGNDILYSEERRMAFQLNGVEQTCGMKVYSTSEGLYLTASPKAVNLTKPEHDQR